MVDDGPHSVSIPGSVLRSVESYRSESDVPVHKATFKPHHSR